MAAWRSTATSSSTCTTAPTVPRAHTRYASKMATAPPRSSNDRRPHHGDPRRGERPATRAGWRGDGDGGRDRRSGEPRPATTPASSPVARRRSLAGEDQRAPGRATPPEELGEQPETKNWPRLGMERLWSLAGATGGNRWQMA